MSFSTCKGASRRLTSPTSSTLTPHLQTSCPRRPTRPAVPMFPPPVPLYDRARTQAGGSPGRAVRLALGQALGPAAQLGPQVPGFPVEFRQGAGVVHDDGGDREPFLPRGLCPYPRLGLTRGHPAFAPEPLRLRP